MHFVELLIQQLEEIGYTDIICTHEDIENRIIQFEATNLYNARVRLNIDLDDVTEGKTVFIHSLWEAATENNLDFEEGTWIFIQEIPPMSEEYLAYIEQSIGGSS